MQGFAHEGAVFSDIRAKDRHASHTGGKREKCLVHGGNHDRSVDLGNIRFQIKK